MNLSPPTQRVFWISVLLVALGLTGYYADLPIVSAYNFYFVLAGYGVLFLGTLFKGL